MRTRPTIRNTILPRLQRMDTSRDNNNHTRNTSIPIPKRELSMKINLTTKYWKQKEGWQKTANTNIWIIILLSLTIETSIIANKNYMYATIFGIIMLTIILPQKITYYQYKKEESKKIREKIMKEVQT